ncbi:hypothetical protein [Cupriavidus sp. D384]|uniref:hypothetical protein n=1 Tax=Cupriavidus sp. D384 TaxID=1538095 RepID=UPI000831CFCB|nr:hypothetical protein [Cupriavidus sp. D384]
MRKILISALMALGLAACATAATEQKQELVGEIHIKGNEPFPIVMLETEAHANWELVGVPLDQARSLTGREVTVLGTVIRAPGPGVWLPSVRVKQMSESKR